MHIDKYERSWIIIFTAILGVFLAALVGGALIFGVRLPDTGRFINPLELHNTEFANPGIRDMGNNRYEVTMIARMWSFQPSQITVPVGAQVTFNITSPDIVHGFFIERHNVNLEVLPGHVGRVTATFNRPGTYRFICHEYCGRGHHLMHGELVVLEAGESTVMNKEN